MVYNSTIPDSILLRSLSDVTWDLSDEEVECLGSEVTAFSGARAEPHERPEVLEKDLNNLDAFTAWSGVHAY